jgi:RHS repeat-associated protein
VIPRATRPADNLFSADPYANRFLYTGREFLKEANLYDYRNRVYSAELGRFLQTDPIRFDAARGRGQSNNSNILTRVSPQLPAIACVGPHGNAMLVASKINDTKIF